MSRIFSYKNPVYSAAIDSVRDCQIIADGGRYYLIGTCPPYWKDANPDIKLYSSDDLLNWRFERLLLNREDVPEDAWYRDRFWAPEIHKVDPIWFEGNEVRSSGPSSTEQEVILQRQLKESTE